MMIGAGIDFPGRILRDLYFCVVGTQNLRRGEDRGGSEADRGGSEAESRWIRG